jgi:hypothetical protein
MLGGVSVRALDSPRLDGTAERPGRDVCLLRRLPCDEVVEVPVLGAGDGATSSSAAAPGNRWSRSRRGGLPRSSSRVWRRFARSSTPSSRTPWIPSLPAVDSGTGWRAGTGEPAPRPGARPPQPALAREQVNSAMRPHALTALTSTTSSTRRATWTPRSMRSTSRIWGVRGSCTPRWPSACWPSGWPAWASTLNIDPTGWAREIVAVDAHVMDLFSAPAGHHRRKHGACNYSRQRRTSRSTTVTTRSNHRPRRRLEVNQLVAAVRRKGSERS